MVLETGVGETTHPTFCCRHCYSILGNGLFWNTHTRAPRKLDSPAMGFFPVYDIVVVRLPWET